MRTWANAMPTATPQPAQTMMQELDQAANVISSIYHQPPMILTRLLLAVVAIIIGVLLLRLLRKLINSRLRRKHESEKRTFKQTETLRSLVNSIVSYLMYFFIALVVLHIFGIDLTSILAVAGIGSIAIGFGAQTLVKDIISGMFLWMEGNINVGDVVTVANCTGRVEAISLRITTLRSTDGRLYAVPNGDIRTVACRSRGLQMAQVNVTIAHGQDLRRAQEALEDECRLVGERLKLTEPLRLYPAIASDARCVTMRVEYPCDVEDDWALEREIRMSMYERLRKEEIKP